MKKLVVVPDLAEAGKAYILCKNHYLRTAETPYWDGPKVRPIYFDPRNWGFQCRGCVRDRARA